MVRNLIIVILAILGWLFGTVVVAGSYLPPGAIQYAPVLVEKQQEIWPDAQEPWTLAGLVEQESCISLKHSKCWNPRAELKTSREYGFGMGQITKAYRKDGSLRFDKFAELRERYKTLQNWSWDRRFDPGFQLTAITEMVRGLYNRASFGRTVQDRWCFSLSAYNGGMGSVLKDRRYCANKDNCDPDVWFGNVAENSLKSKRPQKGYGGRSWFSINRSYVDNVMNLRRAKYEVFWRPT